MGTVINQNSKTQAEALWQSNAHGLLFTGSVGIGLVEAAEYFASSDKTVTLWVKPEKDGVVDYEKGSISISQIRDLYEILKTVDSNGRTVIIDSAEKMAEPAQNAFLKLLEEPPRFVRFVLLTHSEDRLLPTIRSRVQVVDFKPVTASQTNDLLDRLGVFDATKRAQINFIAGGLPAEINKLATDDDYFDKRANIVRDARLLVSGSGYDKLKIAHKYKDSRHQALQLIDDALKQLRQTLKGSSDASLNSALVEKMNYFVKVYDSVYQNGNIRIQLASTLVV